MSSTRSNWPAAEQQDFVNALREFLGLAPLYGKEPTGGCWLSEMLDGNRMTFTGINSDNYINRPSSKDLAKRSVFMAKFRTRMPGDYF